MLARILTTIRAAGQPLCLADLHRELDVEESALEGMLETLVSRGKLRAVRFDDAGCGGCPVRSGCFIMADGVAVTYVLVRDTTATETVSGSRQDEPTIVAS
ncbi:MAG TPA: FeoC-like transcriptional regulator [Candidatus Deferrimicrobium sp.]|nr:FeoC-like transcriptional regulator [Candidatus Deferrimicrobium sp.]